jgi:prepilin-type N-terminal cleavage/methylation domain-containing protein
MVAKLKKHQSGFTLVEIAIVLVIIGLLLGGILKGQELITSARVRNIADQNSGVQAAYYGFIDRYRQVPGDMKAGSANANDACNVIGTTNFATCATAGGNGDGRLDDAANQYQEASAAWAQLAAAGFINGQYTGGATNAATYTAAGMAPVNAFNGFVMLTRSPNFGPAAAASSRLLMFTGRQIPVNVMRELDVKLDDGQPATGILRTVSATASTSDPTNTTAACTTGSPLIWNINGNEPDCNAAYLY